MRKPSNETDDPLLVDQRRAAQILTVSERTLWGLTASGEIPVVRIGRLKRYAVEDLRQFIAEKRGC